MTPTAASTSVIDQCADALATAERTRRPMQPLTELHPSLTLGDAYAIQSANVARRVKAGERVVGRKVGLTAKAMQELFGVHEPDFGHLLDTMFADAATPLDLSELIDPQIEVEPAFVLGRRLAGPGPHQRGCSRRHGIRQRVLRSHRFPHHRLAHPRAGHGRGQRLIGARGAGVAERSAVAHWRSTIWRLLLELDGEVVERGNTSGDTRSPGEWRRLARQQAGGIRLGAGSRVMWCYRAPARAAGGSPAIAALKAALPALARSRFASRTHRPSSKASKPRGSSCAARLRPISKRPSESISTAATRRAPRR